MQLTNTELAMIVTAQRRLAADLDRQAKGHKLAGAHYSESRASLRGQRDQHRALAGKVEAILRDRQEAEARQVMRMYGAGLPG